MLLACLYGSGLSQDASTYKFGSITVDDGLSHNSVNAICQDDFGFLWIGTMDGLNRYDGSRFELFKNIPGDSTSLNNNTIWSLLKGSDNTIYIGTAKGLCRYSYDTNQFENIPLSEDDSNHAIRALCIDHSSQIWTGSIDKSVYRVGVSINDIPTKVSAYTKYNFRAYTPHSLQDIHDTSRVWITHDGMLSSINIITGEEKDWDQIAQYDAYSTSIISSIVQDSIGRLWIGTNTNGLLRFDPTSGEFIQYLPSEKLNSLGSNGVYHLLFGQQGLLWITSFGGGLSVMTDMDKGAFVNFKKKEFVDYALGSNTLTKLIEDNDGRIWIGTHGAGVHYYDQDIAPFQLYRSSEENPLTLSSNNITSIFEDGNNHTWVGTREGGVNKITWSDNGEDIQKLQKYTSNEDDPYSLNINTTNSYLENEEYGLIIGNRLGGLNIYESEKDRFRDYLNQPGDVDAIKNYHVNDMAVSENGDIWMGTSMGIYRWDNEVKRLINYNQVYEQLKDLNEGYIRFLKEEDGILWIGVSNAGLWMWDITNEELNIYDQSKSAGRGLNTDNLLCAHFDHNNNLWIGTWGGGLNKMDLSSNQFEYYTEENGLTNSVVYSIQEDDAGFLWLSTNNGIIRCDPKAESFNSFGVKDGLQGEEYNSFAGYKSERTGRIFFGGMNGLNQFDPSKIEVDTLIPEISITSLSLHQSNEDQPRKVSGVMHKEEISISHRTYLLEFGFGAPKLPKSDNLRYAYRVSGLSNRWIDLGRRQEFSLTNFSPGTYTLDIRAGLVGGRWNDQLASLNIISSPPWWRTMWAYLLYLAIIATILYLLYKNRITQLIKYQNLRTQISSDLHDDVGTILSAMAFQTEILELEQEPEEKEKYKKITDMSRLALGRMRDTVWAIDARKDNAKSLADRMQDFLFDVMESQEFSYDFKKSILNKDLKIAPDVRQTVYLVFKEAITNALKHTNGDHINIELDLNGKGFYLMVKDNGKVDPTKIKKSGLGLSNMRARADKVGADFSYKYHEGFVVEMRKE